MWVIFWVNARFGRWNTCDVFMLGITKTFLPYNLCISFLLPTKQMTTISALLTIPDLLSFISVGQKPSTTGVESLLRIKQAGVEMLANTVCISQRSETSPQQAIWFLPKCIHSFCFQGMLLLSSSQQQLWVGSHCGSSSVHFPYPVSHYCALARVCLEILSPSVSLSLSPTIPPLLHPSFLIREVSHYVDKARLKPKLVTLLPQSPGARIRYPSCLASWNF